jgi:hypothetical protein
VLEGPGGTGFQFLGRLNQAQYLADHPGWFGDGDTAAGKAAHGALLDFQPIDPISPSVLGFMWNDYSILPSDSQFTVDPRRGFVYGQRATEFFLHHASTETKHLQAIFRGHQQSGILNPMMCRLLASRGVFRHWQSADSSALLNSGVSELVKSLDQSEERGVPAGSVWTFNVSPDSVYGEGCGYDFDAFGILKVARHWADWRLRVVNVKIEK